MACGAIPEPFTALNAEAPPVVHKKREPGLSLFSEKK
jgi:hypothetical protein